MSGIAETWLFSLFVAGTVIASGSDADESKYVGPLDQRQIFLHLHVPKVRFLVAEPVPLLSWVENVGNKVEYSRNNWDGTIEVRDSDGEMLPPRITPPHELGPSKFVPGVGNNRFVALKPGETRDKSFLSALDYFGLGKGFYGFYLKPGEYRITGEHVASDTIVFYVVEPTSQEEREASALMMRYAMEVQLSYADSLYPFMTEFLRKFPNSVLAPLALRELASVLSLRLTKPAGADDLLQNYAVQMISQFPESPFVGAAIYDLKPSSLTPEQRRLVVQGLQKAIAINPGTHEAELASELLQKLGN